MWGACGGRRVRRALSLALLLWVASRPASGLAQDEVRDSGSRARRSAQLEAERQGEGVDGDADGPGADLDTDYHLAVFGGYYVQDSRPGLLVDAELEEEVTVGDHEWSAAVAYLHDPFSTKTFNFAADDQDQDVGITQARVVQSMHELDGQLAWRGDWERWLRTDLRLTADGWWPAFARDQRWSVRAYPALRLGGRRGVFSRVAGEFFLKKFPRYLVADRRLDSRGYEIGAEVGYDWGVVTLSGGIEYRVTDYLDARYDRLLPNGSIARAVRSKDYLRTAPFVKLVYEPAKWLRTSLRYVGQLQDSRNYDRRMTGRDADGALVAKLIPSYYDYTRHRLALRARLRPSDDVELEILGELWIRRFDNYEARDRDNTWTGETRTDTSMEIGLEGAWRVVRSGDRSQRHELHVVAFASHLDRASNMKREVSFSTNFAVTRAFVGVELRGP
ncbi:MAG: hypothetical protein PVI30_16440 [Myxococcales bacterium]|jgi:hypothetical protein